MAKRIRAEDKKEIEEKKNLEYDEERQKERRMNVAVKIITDSASNLNRELLDQYGIDMVSLTFERDGQVYPCYDPERSYDEQGKEFYDNLRARKKVKTSLASPGDYYACFQKHLDRGEDILYISISSKLSGTLNSAIAAKEMLEDEYPARKIVCMDSLSASFGEAIVVIEASKLAREGKNVEAIVEAVSSIRLNVRNEFTVDNLIYLKRGGRIESIMYLIGNILDIKPLLRASKEATIELCRKVRGRENSLRALIDTVKETILRPEEQTLYIAHCDCKDDAEKVAEGLKKEIPLLKKIYISMYDFCTGAHVGPGTIALFYFGTARP